MAYTIILWEEHALKIQYLLRNCCIKFNTRFRYLCAITWQRLHFTWSLLKHLQHFYVWIFILIYAYNVFKENCLEYLELLQLMNILCMLLFELYCIIRLRRNFYEHNNILFKLWAQQFVDFMFVEVIQLYWVSIMF